MLNRGIDPLTELHRFNVNKKVEMEVYTAGILLPVINLLVFECYSKDVLKVRRLCSK